jgi:hypothetical protein
MGKKTIVVLLVGLALLPSVSPKAQQQISGKQTGLYLS